MATLWGPIIAAFVVVGLSQGLADFGAWRDIVIALAIIGVIAVYPGGLFAVLQELRHQLDRVYTAWRARWVRQSTASDRDRLMGVPDRLIQTRHGAISVCDTERGDQTVVMVHGNSSCKEVFHHQFAALRDRYRVVAFDLPGHGVSANGAPERDYNLDAYASILAELVDRLQLGSPVVVGWSLGGYVAIEYAAAGHPTAGLVITGTSPIGQYPEDMPKGYIPTPHMELAGKRFHSRHEKAQYATHTTGLARADTPFAWQAVYRCDGEARKRAFAAFKTVDWPRQLALWRTDPLPIAMLNGRSDPFINPEYCDRQCEGAVGLVTNHPFVDVGHAPFLEAPTAFNAVLEQVLTDCLSKQQASVEGPSG
ncbi:MAG: alpha/beta fold hydrolase [Pseudomonadota bacterium]